MGNYPSKTGLTEELFSIEEEVNRFEGDPRSPSVDINRTPLQKQLVKTKPITKKVDLSKECFDKYEESSVNPAIKALMNEMDPRSPAMDFQRTPLAFMMKKKDSVLAHNSSNFLNESDMIPTETLNTSNTGIITDLAPKNLCKDLGDLSSIEPDTQKVLFTEINTGLDSSSIDNKIILTEISDSIDKNDSIECNTVCGLLETNLDYLETDLDTVRRRRKVTIKPQKDASPNLFTTVDDRPVVNNDLDINTDLSKNDPRSPTAGIDRTPILVTEIRNRENIPKSNKKANSQMKEVFKNNVKLQQKKLSEGMLLEKDVIKKITDSLLIYEDASIDANSSNNLKKNVPTNEGVRTPLACMINIDKSRPNSKQNTPSNENKIDYQMKIDKSAYIKSKIPIRVVKGSPTENIKSVDLKLKARRIVHSEPENTPPQLRKACWDTDNSVVL